MGTVIRPELSKKNRNWIEKHRYYELKHFCMQYNIWKQTYVSLGGLASKPEATEMLRNKYSMSNPSRAQRNISKFVDVVRNYDTWRWKELGVEGIVCKQVNDLFYIYRRDTFISWVNMQMNTSKAFPDFLDTDKILLDFRKNDIDRYVEEKNLSLMPVEDKDHCWFGLVFADRYISELGNRLCEMNPGLEYVAIVNISTGQVSYRTISDDINLGTEIAHAYGGGGHPKAAGSTFDINTAIQKIGGFIFRKDNDTYKGNE